MKCCKRRVSWCKIAIFVFLLVSSAYQETFQIIGDEVNVNFTPSFNSKRRRQITTTTTPIIKAENVSSCCGAKEPGNETAPKHATTAATATGPSHFCERTDLPLYRTNVRNIICQHYFLRASSGSEAEPPSLQLSERKNESNKKRTIIFLHIPKTGGESLEEYFRLPKRHKPANRRLWQYGQTNHTVAVTIIRNPFDRMFSWFRFCLHGHQGRLPGPPKHCLEAHMQIQVHQPLKNGTTRMANHTTASLAAAFESWLLNVFSGKVRESNPINTYLVTLPMVGYLEGSSTSSSSSSDEEKFLMIDYAIRFEHYAEDLQVLVKALSGRNQTAAPPSRKNGSSGKCSGTILPDNPWGVRYNEQVVDHLTHLTYRDLYTVRAREIVQVHFAQDLQVFQYAF